MEISIITSAVDERHTRLHGTLPLRYTQCHIANILFCFYNEQYWLYAVENYGFNLSFLFIVGYVCRAYVLKGKNVTGM